jgi:pimeloyl-ACP methyl ester carboxylesterase
VPLRLKCGKPEAESSADRQICIAEAIISAWGVASWHDHGVAIARGATVVLVHGAWHGAWCWDEVVRRLDTAGIPNVALDNPSVTNSNASLADDVDNVTQALDKIDGPVVLVGHSYGGAIVTDAGTHPLVRHLVYCSAFALDVGESVMKNSLVGGEVGPLDEALCFDGDVVTVDRAGAIAAFYHDCADEVARAAASQLRPQAFGALGGVVRAAAWRTIASTYLLCTDDRALTPALQRSSAARVSTTVEIAASHSPFLSRPNDVADLLCQLAQ